LDEEVRDEAEYLEPTRVPIIEKQLYGPE